MTQKNPVQITFRRLPHSDLVEQEVEAQVDHLHQFCDRIHGCQVVLEPDERHHREGNRVRARVHVHVPGRELISGRHPARAGHEDPLLAVRDAFRAIGRQLQDYTGQRRERLPQQVDPTKHGTVTHLEADHGFLESLEGRELYFHRNSVVNTDFEELTLGTQVRFHEEAGEQGPQASSVALTAAE